MNAMLPPFDDPRSVERERAEGLQSFTLRLAACRCLAGESLDHVTQARYGVTAREILDGTACDAVAYKEQVCADELAAATWVWEPTAKRYRLGKERLRSSQLDLTHVRFCPACSNQGHGTGAHPASIPGAFVVPAQDAPAHCWSAIKAVQYCPLHRRPLVSIRCDEVFRSLPAVYPINAQAEPSKPDIDVSPEIFLLQRLGFGGVLVDQPTLTSRFVEDVPLEILLRLALVMGTLFSGEHDRGQATRLGLACLLINDLDQVFEEFALKAFEKDGKWPKPRALFGRFNDFVSLLKNTRSAPEFVRAFRTFCASRLRPDAPIRDLFDERNSSTVLEQRLDARKLFPPKAVAV